MIYCIVCFVGFFAVVVVYLLKTFLRIQTFLKLAIFLQPLLNYFLLYFSVTPINIRKKKSNQKQSDFIMRREKRHRLQEYHANSYIPTLKSGAVGLKAQVSRALKEKRTGILKT